MRCASWDREQEWGHHPSANSPLKRPVPPAWKRRGPAEAKGAEAVLETAVSVLGEGRAARRCIPK